MKFQPYIITAQEMASIIVNARRRNPNLKELDVRSNVLISKRAMHLADMYGVEILRGW